MLSPVKQSSKIGRSMSITSPEIEMDSSAKDWEEFKVTRRSST